MDFGDLDDITSVDFSLKKPKVFSKDKHSIKSWYLGCPVWSNKELIKRLSKDESKEHELGTYARSFNSIELNSSYYSIPSESQVDRWRSLTPKDFKFFPKAPKDLCFHSYENLPTHLLDLYFNSLDHFGDQMEESFLQFSPYISPREKRYLFLLLESLPKSFQFSIELRHPDWFNDKVQLQRLCEYLNKKDIGLVITDTPGRRDVLSMVFTTNRIFVRFKGNNGSEKDFERIDEWMKIFNSLDELEKIYFFHHHSKEENCIETIDYMSECIKESKNEVPKINLKTEDQLILI